MKKPALFLFFIHIHFFLLAQSTTPESRSSLQFNFGRSFNGTGDISGFQYGLTFAKSLGKKTYWSVGFEGTLHDDERTTSTFDDGEGNTFESKSRYVTGGIQLVGNFGYDFIKNFKHAFGLSVGPLIRYQSSSIPDSRSTLFPIVTDLPFPVERTEYTNPFRTIALGAVLKLNYYYTFDSNFMLGLTGGFQTDTNGDTISYLSLGFGKRF